MDHGDKTILVIGATGHQGGAAVTHLLQDGWHVRALSHHPDSPAAQALAARGVELVPGDLLDRASLDRAVAGAYGVFSMQGLSQGPDAEEAEGKNIANAAAAAGVRHFVYNSVEGAQYGDEPGVAPKHHIEGQIRDLGLPATIFRPVLFMENFLGQRDNILGGKLTGPAWPESMAYLISVDDIGRFVALAFRQPERFVGESMAIAGDAMTQSQIAETFSRALGIPVEFEHAEVDWAPTPPRPVPGERQYVRADIDACRDLIPQLATLEQWIERTGWRV